MRALLHKPKLLLLDEPSAGLDQASRQALINETKELNKDGVTIVWSTHLLDEIDETAKLIVLDKGRVLANCDARGLRTQTGERSLKSALDKLRQNKKQ